jgi:hypothetical protein
MDTLDLWKYWQWINTNIKFADGYFLHQIFVVGFLLPIDLHVKAHIGHRGKKNFKEMF